MLLIKKRVKKFILKISLLFILLFSVKGYSQYWEVDLTLGTFHYNRTYLNKFTPTRFIEFNPGIIVQKRIDNLKIGGGYFKNSYGKNSLLGTVGYVITPNIDLNVGAATGYQDTDMDKEIMPMLVLSYRIKSFKIGVSPQFILYSFNLRL